MTERADLSGLPLGRAASAGGAARLLQARNGYVAVNLPRADDWDLVPAWLERTELAGWDALAVALADRDADDLVDRARLLGLAAARADFVPPSPPAIVSTVVQGATRAGRGGSAPLILDMSTLWAGPLCGHLLERMGATVIKVESPSRVDGARRGNAHFYALLNQGKQCVSLDPATAEGRAQLLCLIDRADIVIESSRPRALRQLGIDAEKLVCSRPGLTWIAISGYGRTVPEEDWIAYGDDAGAASGLSALLHRTTGQWAFVGDAIADPLTGIHAALAAWRNWRAGGSKLLSLSLSGTVSFCMARERADDAAKWDVALTHWFTANSSGMARTQSAPRTVDGPVFPVGAHNAEWLDTLLPC